MVAVRRTGRGSLMLVAVAVALALGACGDDASSEGGAAGGSQESGDLPKLKVTQSGIATDMLNNVALGQGFFEKRGVDVEVNDLAGANTNSLVVAGRADIGIYSVLAPMLLANEGKDAVLIYGNGVGATGGAMVARPEIKSLEDLKKLDKCRIASSPPGASSYGYAELYMAQHGFKCDHVGMVDAPTQVAALAAGRVDALVGGYAGYAAAVAEGKGRLIVDTRDPAERQKYLGDDFVDNAIWGLKSNLDSKRDAVVKYMQALDDARKFINDATPEEVTTALREASPNWRELTEEQSLENVKTGLAYLPPGPPYGIIPEEKWDEWLHEKYRVLGLPNFEEIAPKLTYDKVVDMSFLNEALGEESG